MVIDSHVHLWDPSLRPYPWLGEEPKLGRPYRPADLGAEEYGVAGIVVVEAGCRADHATDEVTWIEQLSGDAPVIRAVVAQAPLELGVRVAPVLADLAARPLVVGVRRNVQDEPPGFMDAPDFVAGVTALSGTGLTFDACVRDHQLRELTHLVDRVPEVTFVLDHLGKPGIAERRWSPWRDDLTALARRPNVFAKLSGLTTEAGPNWRPADLAPYLRHALDVFGPGRCMYGSDWPVATLATDYEPWLRVIRDLVAELAAPAGSDVLGGTATRVYGLAA